MELSKVDAVQAWPVPTKVKEVQSFLELANFYRRLIKDFSKVAAPLHKLMRKEQEWTWGPEQQDAFYKLKQ